MREITAKQAARAAGGRGIFGDPEKKICHISLDSRKMAGNDLFVPIIGERADGHDYICMAIGNGATVVFTSRHKTEEEVQEAILTQCKVTKKKRQLQRQLPGSAFLIPEKHFRILELIAEETIRSR